MMLTDTTAYRSSMILQMQIQGQNCWFWHMLVRTGDSARGLPACESCHNPRSGGPVETPVLFAQTKEYVAAQLTAYKAGERSNDLYRRMRSIAEKLTDAEIQQLGQYYYERR
jgi:cytochrome c553